MKYLTLVLLIAGVAFSQPCESWECDSTVVSEILQANGYYDPPFVVNGLTSTNDSGRIISLVIWADSTIDFDSLKSSSLLGRLTELEHLTIRSKKTPLSITKLDKLRILWLAETETLPDTICSMINLTRLDVSKSALTSLPDSIGRLKNLEYLDVSNNNLTEIPESIGDLDKLVYLYADNNNIEELPSSITDMDSIHTLDFSYNNISTLPGPWDGPKPEWLFLRHNNFSVFPDVVFDGSDNLWLIFQYHDDLTTFPEDMSNMKINRLDLSECGISELPIQLTEIKGLQRLSLQNNNLTTIPYEFMENDSLNIFVKGNLLNDIPDTLIEWLNEHAEPNWQEYQRDSITGTKDSPNLSHSLKTGIDLTRKSNSSFNINYSLNNESRVDISVYDISGRLVRDIFRGTRQAGAYSESFKTSGLSAGAYYLRVIKEGSMSVRKFVVMR